MCRAPAERSGDGALDCLIYGTSYPKRCRATLATAFHMLSPTLRSQLFICGFDPGAHAPGFMPASAPRTRSNTFVCSLSSNNSFFVINLLDFLQIYELVPKDTRRYK